MRINTRRDKDDTIRWDFSRNGIYELKSGYKLLETIVDINSDQPTVLLPLEKKLWRDLWKTKNSPKLRHFLWKIMVGALTVKSQLRSCGIHLDPTCTLCGQERETICHMLFHYPSSKAVWKRSGLPLSPAGFSTSSIFFEHALFTVL